MLQAVLASVLAFSVSDRNPAYFVVVGLGVLCAWVFSVRPHRPAPRMAINTVLLLVVVVAGAEMLRVGVGVSAFAVFAALLLVVKLLDLRTARDDGQILVLTVAVLIAAVLTSNDLATGFMAVASIVLVLRAVILFQLHTVLGLSARADGVIDKPARIDIRSMMVASMFICALVGAVVFVVLPRNVGSRAFGQWGSIGRSISGFSDEVELGRPGLISSSSTPVLDLSVTDRNGRNIGSEGTPAVYLRGAVLEEYDRGRWNRGTVMRGTLSERINLYPPNTSLKYQGAVENASWDQQFNIAIRSSNDGPAYLFAPWRTVEFRVGDSPMRLGLDFARGLFFKDGMGGPVEYTVRSVNAEFREPVVPQDATRDPVTPTLIAPQIGRLASDIVTRGGIEPDPATRPISDDRAAVRLLENYLRTQYAYTLDAQPVPPGEDATKWFLFDRKAGHCEFFASALALLARSVGVPARVITGYVVSDFNPLTGQYIVRESNAHAWVEAEIAPNQWRTFDGTPPSDFHALHDPNRGFFGSFSRMYESAEYFWARTVVGYDARTRQRIMGKGPGDFGLTRLGDRLLSRIAAGRARLVTRAGVVAGLVFAASLFVGIVVLRYQSIFAALYAWWLSVLARLRHGLTGAAGDDSDPLGTRLESVVNRTLARMGLPRPEWRPLKAHLALGHDQLAATPAALASLDEAAELLYRHRFAPGQGALDRQRVARLVATLRKSEKKGRAAQKHRPIAR